MRSWRQRRAESGLAAQSSWTLAPFAASTTPSRTVALRLLASQLTAPMMLSPLAGKSSLAELGARTLCTTTSTQRAAGLPE